MSELKNVFTLNCGDYLVEAVTSDAHIEPAFAKYKLLYNIKHCQAKTEEEIASYWASIRIGQIETRYRIIGGVFTKHSQYNWNNVKKYANFATSYSEDGSTEIV